MDSSPVQPYISSLMAHRAIPFVAAILLLMPLGDAWADENACSCAHSTAICVPYKHAGVDKRACVYLLNLHGPDVRQFQRADLTESQLLNRVLGGTDKETHEYFAEHARARFFQVTSGIVSDERVSTEGVLLTRAFVDATDYAETDGAPIDLARLSTLKLRIGEKKFIPGDEDEVVHLKDVLESSKMGDVVKFEVTHNEAKTASRYSWYRPRSGWVVDYSLAGVAFSWPSWKFEGSPESAIIPAMVELEYRYYKRNGGFYIFGGLGIGPNIALNDADLNDSSRSSSGLNGLVGAATLNINGFQLGFGTRWEWSKGRFDPMLTISLTEALTRGLGITGKLPDNMVEVGD